MFGLGFSEIVVILIIALIFIGPNKIPDVARSLGKTYRELQRALTGIREEVDNIDNSIKEELRKEKDGSRKGSEAKAPSEKESPPENKV